MSFITGDVGIHPERGKGTFFEMVTDPDCPHYGYVLFDIDVPLCIGGYAPGPAGFCDICIFRNPCTDREKKA